MAGYSHRTLRQKLDIQPGMRLYFHNAPADVLAELGDLDDDTSIVNSEEIASYLHYFITTKSQLKMIAERVEHLKEPHQIFWISWPKKASGVPTEITEDDLRAQLLPTGLVDVKVCAVSDVYSGLKFVWRKI
jgi:hypothetical protein